MLEPVEVEMDPPYIVIDAAPGVPASVLDDIKRLARPLPGRYRLVIAVGARTLTLGPEWAVTPSLGLVEALGKVGTVTVRHT